MAHSAFGRALLLSAFALCALVACDDDPAAGGGEGDASRADADLLQGDGGGDPDAGRSDAGLPDAMAPDAARADAGESDANLPDAEMADAEIPDADPPDADQPDMDLPDAEMADAACVPAEEACNGEDDDCDGTADEDFAELGSACMAGVGACAAAGEIVCAEDGAATRCDAEPALPQAELCDGLDNDCDGSTDESIVAPCYDGPEGTAGVGQCQGGMRRCVDGALGACEGQVVPGDEACNGRDDDCDGRPDEGEDGPLTEACFVGEPAMAGVGLCRAGLRTCQDGALGACVGAVGPAPEICDEQDNDCDGRPDDGLACACQPGTQRACYGGPEGTEDVGVCRGGSQVCRPDGMAYGPCVGQALPANESCDGVDNDCNGVVDDNIAGAGEVCRVGVGACAAEGQVQCDAAAGGLLCSARAGQPRAERCDGLDNDCDGATDETFNLGAPCQMGQGACARNGVRVCGPNGEAICSGGGAEPQPEVCNGQDDDCDGSIDEGGVDGAGPLARPCYNGPAGTAGQGQCRAGQQLCVDGAFGACEGEVGPEPEICDGVDNDCDGTADVGPAGPLVQPCYEGPAGSEGVGPCRGGQRQCQGGAFGACQDQVLPAAEACDGVDNNCDGEVDNRADGLACVCEPGLRQPCYGGPEGTAGVGQCQQGAQTCNLSGTGFGACQGEVRPSPVEICDNIDNNCDGATDEGGLDGQSPGPLAQSCYTGPEGTAGVGQCRGGQRLCQAGRFGACAGEQVPVAELCDGEDNDCDASIDEAFPQLGGACEVGVGRCQGQGNFICAPDGQGVACVGEGPAPIPEQCNTVDDDCDGEIDEDFDVGGDCVSGQGVCARPGALRCTLDGAIQCDAVAGNPDPGGEACDNLDNDCDGTTDEGFAVGQQCFAEGNGCRVEGVTVCDADGNVVCSESAPLPVPEACNGADDDCDGNIDEDFQAQLGGDCTVGEGICQAQGQQVCSGRPDVPALSFAGPRTDLSIAEAVDGGFEVCFVEPYNAARSFIVGNDPETGAPGALTACNQNVLMLGCRRTDAPDLTVAAMGNRAEVLAPIMFAEREPNNPHNGVNWYFNDNYSWGFAPAGAPIDVFTCDQEQVRGDERLCWYTSLNRIRAGYRCGADIVNASGLWERVILHRPGTVDQGAAGRVVCSVDPGEPGVEACNTLDDDCDGAADEDFPVGDACTAGVGGCARPGQLQCDLNNGGPTCSATPGQPQAEICNEIDDDCDGTTDEGYPLGGPCSVGVGACANEGVTVCNAAGDGVTCGAEPGMPGFEICNGFDDDCDGVADEGAGGCALFPSCLAAQRAGQNNTGPYLIQPDPGAPAEEVWCDMQTDGGGWTLVASSGTVRGRGITIDDRARPWFPELRAPNPERGNTGVWSGPRVLSETFDVRFTCRRDPNGDPNAPFDVDLSVYDTDWYATMTSGLDRDSCLNIRNAPPQAPGRRNNLTGQVLPAGDPWNTGSLVSEDTCEDGGDFTIDFDDGGMNGDPSDGTDWGEANGARRCGQTNQVDGQWFIYMRER